MDEFVNISADRYEKLIEELTELRLKVKELEKDQLPAGRYIATPDGNLLKEKENK